MGDIGYLDDDGFLFLCDRKADMIISGGVNIYPAEVEAELIMHPGVADVAVFGVPDEEWGERVMAVIEPAADRTPGPELAAEILGSLDGKLARLKWPTAIDFTARCPAIPAASCSNAACASPTGRPRAGRSKAALRPVALAGAGSRGNRGGRSAPAVTLSTSSSRATAGGSGASP